jgi:hypothetical protein
MAMSTERSACSGRVFSGCGSNITGKASSPAERWARRKRHQKMLAILVAIVLVAAQAYGWLSVLRIV